MDKVKMTTPDGVTENIEKLGALFPAAVTEMRGEDGTLRKGIDFEKLRQLLSRDIVEGGERYEFSWVGKKAAMAEAARPTTETLRPPKLVTNSRSPTASAKCGIMPTPTVAIALFSTGSTIETVSSNSLVT